VELIHDSCPARARHKRAALPPSRYGPEVEGVTMLCDTSTHHLRPLVPRVDCLLVFKAIHGIAHPGICATRRLITALFLWPKMNSDIASWCRDCVPCQSYQAASNLCSTNPHPSEAIQPCACGLGGSASSVQRRLYIPDEYGRQNNTMGGSCAT
jgi:hypothetical protein